MGVKEEQGLQYPGRGRGGGRWRGRGCGSGRGRKHGKEWRGRGDEQGGTGATWAGPQGGATAQGGGNPGEGVGVANGPIIRTEAAWTRWRGRRGGVFLRFADLDHPCDLIVKIRGDLRKFSGGCP